ncbi:MAG: LPS assembly protein LptD, partial [Phycisphaerales bacterium]
GPGRAATESQTEFVPEAEAFVGQDLHMTGQTVTSHQLNTGEHILVFRDRFSMTIGANQFASDNAVVWLIHRSAVVSENTIQKLLNIDSTPRVDYKAIVYLQDNVWVEKAKGAKTTNLTGTVIEQGRMMVIQFSITGEVFITADNRRTADPRGSELYENAFEGLRTVGIRPISAEAQPQETGIVSEKKVPTTPQEPNEVDIEPQEEKPHFRYPINISGSGGAAIKIEWDDTAKIWTVMNRFYLWQKQDEKGGLLELQADNAVIFHSGQGAGGGNGQSGIGNIFEGGDIKSIYICGDILMTEGQRTIRAEEMYYDFEEKKAIAVKAIMRNFDTSKGIPIYLKALTLRQISENTFAAENVTVTTSEFYKPQISLNASSVIVTDTSIIDAQQGRLNKGSYDAQMRDVRFNMYDTTLFYWPYLRSNMERPDIPLKSIHVGNDNTWGTSVETRWYLARLLGLEEPPGTESTLALDYFGDRGFGAGVEVDYAKENYSGKIVGYIINDRGEDKLGRNSSRKHLEPERDLRGRFGWKHRQFLPYNWQLTAELSYLSDEHFLEGFYRSEFYVGKQQETLLHMKRIEDNWGLSILTKVRINDFANELEELPSAEFHWTGQSLFGDNFTFYSDSQVGRFRQRYAEQNVPAGPQKFFTLTSTRNELDLPMTIDKLKVVPFVAGTMAYEDGMGFYSDIDGNIIGRDDSVWFGEAGVRASLLPFWKVFPDVKSETWDLDQLRHIVKPYVTAAAYTQSDSVIKQRDTLSIGLSQRLQTKRGVGKNRRTVDWMKLDIDFTWVNNSDDEWSSAGADRFIWNKPFIPLLNSFHTVINPLNRHDRRSSNIFGPRRNYFSADYTWRLSDTTAILSDMNFDMQSGVTQQFNVGFSHMRWPDLSYYIGSRYLRRVNNNFGEKGSNAFTYSATYALDPRYTMVYSGQIDFDYGKTVRNDVTLIRRYHRVYCGFTFSADASLDRQAIVFSIWPQGVPELAIGPRRYIGLTDSTGY